MLTRVTKLLESMMIRTHVITQWKTISAWGECVVYTPRRAFVIVQERGRDLCTHHPVLKTETVNKEFAHAPYDLRAVRHSELADMRSSVLVLCVQ